MQEFTKSITVQDLLQVQRLHLERVCGKRYITRSITTPNVNRPGLALCGHMEHFLPDAIQLFGPEEYGFCVKTRTKTLQASISNILSKGQVPCVILMDDLNPPPAVKKTCLKAEVPVLKTTLSLTDFSAELRRFLDEHLAPITHLHGVLLNVSGMGVLIKGEAGIGKSECALELIKRGHILIADDVVEVQKRWGRFLTGTCPEMLKHYMEVRGLGILDIDLLFGVGATQDEINIGMEIVLTPPADTIDRLGVEQKTTKILGVEIPSMSIPVTPGRNLAILIEVAVLNQQLKSQGILSAQQFSQKVMGRTKSKTRNHATTEA